MLRTRWMLLREAFSREPVVRCCHYRKPDEAKIRLLVNDQLAKFTDELSEAIMAQRGAK